jgi:hypothetical protein
MKPYDYLPEPPVNPPELSPGEEDRRERNYTRQQGIDAIDRLELVLYELSDHNGNGFQNLRKDLEATRGYLWRDMED